MKKQPNIGSVRVISGKHRGRKITFPTLPGVRPSPDRIRETLFNWLMNDIIDARCLDVFAGSGILGIEALSRGATHLTAWEQQKPLAANLQQQLATLGLTAHSTIQCADSFTLLSKANASPYDLVFLDPPFNQNLIPSCLDKLRCNHWIHAGSYVYIESEVGYQLESKLILEFEALRRKKSGDVAYQLLRYQPAA
ncbi:16S rRNA (guanine(966)-N(2))-methyltransferase RsmD [Piscirickettsia litoralis]|uniref:Ribosomal RNA small subunit methyltransferase D n=1 Tax=Piscirickettsia litoralis TaxID=1891921 RepID=A0ABX3A3L5_9GAMM|nr:16S rRNA (guanine(966)-N(2))-methyltransferase RsmD [Piscirickettsia litoralis]ODN43438.1 16S rRNA (guanine(966)-N(2))-methyltransferase RsmD [Piscirickettsia litoralis]